MFLVLGVVALLAGLVAVVGLAAARADFEAHIDFAAHGAGLVLTFLTLVELLQLANAFLRRVREPKHITLQTIQ